jgi:23S rRNA pseudouridine2605 synthase
MRINKFVAQTSGLSRRAADQAIADGRVHINGQLPQLGARATDQDSVTLDGTPLQHKTHHTTIMLNKPRGYVCSRDGQGSQTVYDLLPPEYHALKPVGRLDKDSSGLLLLTDDGDLANQLTHPRYAKTKIYNVTLDQPLAPLHQQMITDYGLTLEDGTSRLQLERLDDARTSWRVTMQEGRNRQIRRTFAAVGYQVQSLHRINFGDYVLGDLKSGATRVENLQA